MPVAAWLRAGGHPALQHTHIPGNKYIRELNQSLTGRVKIKARLGLLLMSILFLNSAVTALCELKFLDEGWGRGAGATPAVRILQG